MGRPFFYGGQALIEGVMIRGQRNVAIACRNPEGEIIVHAEPLLSKVYTSRWVKVPFLRGVAVLGETMALGIRSLLFSANVNIGKVGTELNTGSVIGMVMMSLTFAIALFFVAPLALTSSIDSVVHSSFISNLIEGAIRLAFLIGYIGLIGRMPDVRRVFGYHGAEHKVVNAFEDDRTLDVPNVQTCSTQHPRCGTAFLLTLVVISIFVFGLFGRPSMEMRILTRIVLIPVIAGVSYEILRLAANNIQHRWVRILYAPNLALQGLTTREPDDSQVEVAIAAMSRVLADDGLLVQETATAEPVRAAVGSPA